MALWDVLSTERVSDDKTLIMNRTNGRWAIVASGTASCLEDTATGDRGDRDRLVSELRRRALFEAPYAPPDHLNTLILKITKRCNYGCEYCYDLEADDEMTDLPLDTASAAIEEALTLSAAPVSPISPKLKHPDLGVILHGGEPTLRWAFIEEVVERAEAHAVTAGKVVAFTIQSNLSHLNDRMVEFSRRHHIIWGVSLDGPPQLNDRFRVLSNGAGTYAHFERALNKYPDFVRNCGVLTTVTAATQSELLTIARHLKDLGMPSWKWSLFQPIGMGRHRPDVFDFSTEKVIAAWNELFDAVEAGEFDGFDVGPITEYLQNLITGPGPNMCKRNGCGAARDLLSVSSDGSIEACDCIDRKGDLAHLGLIQIQTKDSLTRALESERGRAIRSRDVTGGSCGTCTWLALCGGTCMAVARTVHGKDEQLCALAMNAYTRIVRSLAAGNALRRYFYSTQETPDQAQVSA